MEESSTKAEERVTEKKTYHPCHLLEEALKALFSCLGFDSESKESVQKTSSDEDQITENSSDNQKGSQESSASQEQAADVQQINSATQLSSEVSARAIVRRRPSRPRLSEGSGPQIN